jgi:hypothetical protein
MRRPIIPLQPLGHVSPGAADTLRQRGHGTLQCFCAHTLIKINIVIPVNGNDGLLAQLLIVQLHLTPTNAENETI